MDGRQDIGIRAMPMDSDSFNHVVGHLPPLQSATETGAWFMRLVYFPPGDNPEMAWDVHSSDGIAHVHLFRFQASARHALEDARGMVSTERGKARLPENEPLVLEVQKGLCLECQNFGDNTPAEDIYFLYFQHGQQSHQSYACNPRHSDHDLAEPWQRLINRVTGSGLLVQRGIHLE